MSIHDTRRLCNFGFMVIVAGGLMQLLLSGPVGDMCLLLGGGMVLWSEVTVIDDEG